MVKSSFWPHTVDTYDLFRLVLENPRIPKNHISRKFNVKNPKTGEAWINSALKKQIIGVPVFRRKSFLNFREYFYFIKTDYPHKLFEDLKKEENLMYFCVQSGPSNFQVISTEEIDLKGDVILSGYRSDYFVTVPPKSNLENALPLIVKKSRTINETGKESPLIFHESAYEKWDNGMEDIYKELHNDIRKPFLQVIKNVNTYSNKIAQWMKTRDEFGQTIVTYFPQGVAAYQLTLFFIETEYDALLIDLFSHYPVSTVFYRLDTHVVMSIYLPFPYESRSFVHEVLTELAKKELVGGYTHSTIEYAHIV